MQTKFALGQWNAICDVCGFKKKSGQLRKRWDGLMVCKRDWETRHPADLLRLKPERAPPPWVRPQPTDQFHLVCTLWGSSPYADLATADCAHADVGSPALSYAYIYALYVDSQSFLSFPTLTAPSPAPAPAPSPPPSSPGLLFNSATNSDYLALVSVGGL